MRWLPKLMGRQLAGQPSALTPWQEFQLALKKNDADVPALVFARDHRRPTLRVTRINYIEFENNSDHGRISAEGVFDKYERYVNYKIDLYIQSYHKYEANWSTFIDSSSASFVIPESIFVDFYKIIMDHGSSYDIIFKILISGPGKKNEFDVVEYPCHFESLQFRPKGR